MNTSQRVAREIVGEASRRCKHDGEEPLYCNDCIAGEIEPLVRDRDELRSLALDLREALLYWHPDETLIPYGQSEEWYGALNVLARADEILGKP